MPACQSATLRLRRGTYEHKNNGRKGWDGGDPNQGEVGQSA